MADHVVEGPPATSDKTAPEDDAKRGRIARRVTVNLRQQDVDRLDRIAKEAHLQPTDAIRRALATEAFVIRNRKEGRKILVEDESGNLREVEFLY